MDVSYDVLFVGGGLASTLAGLKLQEAHPDLNFLILESATKWGGEHTWCLHESDLGKSFEQHWIRPLITKTWDSYEVRFPRIERQLCSRYAAIRSSDARPYVEQRLHSQLRLRQPVEQLRGNYVTMNDGSIYSARCVIDARGYSSATASHANGYQKFFGQLIRTEKAHGLTQPVLMDATVTQIDGFRFIYLLPFSDNNLLIEDTRFELSAGFHQQSYERGINQYCKENGWEDHEVLYTERGSLPLPLHGAQSPVLAATTASVGMAGGLFHAATGYSIGAAIKFAEWLTANVLADDLDRKIRSYCTRHWEAQCFYRRLNNMLFFAGIRNQERGILEKFYQLDPDLIARFYSSNLSWLDKLKILSGKPPVPVTKGLTEFFRQRASVA